MRKILNVIIMSIMMITFMQSTPVLVHAQPSIGDVNGDGVIDEADINLIRQHVLSLQELPPNVQPFADVNCDGTISTLDLVLISQFINGIIDSFPCEELDLTLQNISIGNDCRMTVTVANVGAVAVADTTFFTDAEPMKGINPFNSTSFPRWRIVISDIPAGTTQTFTSQPSVYFSETVTVTVDSQNTVMESNEANNQFTITVPEHCQAQPDLIVENVTFDAECNAQFTIANVGWGDITQNFSFNAEPLFVEAWPDPPHTGWGASIFGLPADQSIVQTWQDVTVFNSSVITVTVDPQNGIFESDDTNNVSTFPVPEHCQMWESSSISGTKFNDLNGDGIWQYYEPAINGNEIPVTIFLYPIDLTTCTLGSGTSVVIDAEGNYEFNDIAAGDYVVTEQALSPSLGTWFQTFPSDSTQNCQQAGEYIVTIEPGDTVIDLDFGNHCLSCTGIIPGVKYHDLNQNGKLDDDELLIPNWSVSLSPSTGSGPVSGETTDSNGVYLYTDVANGSYTLSEQAQTCWFQTAPPFGTYVVDVDNSGASLIQMQNANGIWEEVDSGDFGNFEVDDCLAPESDVELASVNLEVSRGKGKVVFAIANVGKSKTDGQVAIYHPLPAGIKPLQEKWEMKGWRCGLHNDRLLYCNSTEAMEAGYRTEVEVEVVQSKESKLDGGQLCATVATRGDGNLKNNAVCASGSLKEGNDKQDEVTSANHEEIYEQYLPIVTR